MTELLIKLFALGTMMAKVHPKTFEMLETIQHSRDDYITQFFYILSTIFAMNVIVAIFFLYRKLDKAISRRAVENERKAWEAQKQLSRTIYPYPFAQVKFDKEGGYTVSSQPINQQKINIERELEERLRKLFGE